MTTSTATTAINLSDDTLISARLTDYLRTQTGTAWTLGRFTRYAVGFRGSPTASRRVKTVVKSRA